MDENFNERYRKLCSQYQVFSKSMRPYQFFEWATSKGTSRYFAGCMLRDFYGMNLFQIKAVMDLLTLRLESKSPKGLSELKDDSVCFHLKPLLGRLEAEPQVEKLKVLDELGWGRVVLLKNVPPLQSLDWGDLDDCVQIDRKKNAIVCVECWCRIADVNHFE